VKVSLGELEKRIKDELTKLKNYPYPTVDADIRLEQCLKLINEAKKEYPYGFSVSVGWRQKDEWFKKWFGEKEAGK